MNHYQIMIKYTLSNDEMADTNDNVVKEEDSSNVVPVVNNDKEWATW